MRLLTEKKSLIEQVVQTLRKSDNKPISRLTKVFNHDNDIKIKVLTGLTKDEGLQEYLLDSIYYDANGNDTLKINFVHLDKWYRTQITRKTFRIDNQIEYFITERRIEGRPYFKKEIFYKYSDTGHILSETEFECSQMVDCDSLYKKTFFPNSNGGSDSTIYTWTDKKWNEMNKNGR